MNINPLVTDALSSIGLPIEPDKYTGTETEHITFNYVMEIDEFYEDGEPMDGNTYIQVHYWTKGNPHPLKPKIKQLLRAAGFHVTGIQQFYESDTKYNHVVYEAWISDI